MKEFNKYIETNQWLKELMDQLSEEEGMRLEDSFYAFNRYKTDGECHRSESQKSVIYKLELHEQICLPNGIYVLRVPGGWIYESDRGCLSRLITRRLIIR